ncbi:MAG: homocysteine S-methyltransferase family protein [Clostridia bacterium]|nr:homocysteine S-methyltransferase family protein [Clostridia bacterium]
MVLPFQLPVAAESIAADHQTDGDTDDSFSVNIGYISKQTRIALQNGANMLISPTDGINRRRLEEHGYDDDFSHLFKTVTAAVASGSDSNIPVCGVISPDSNICKEYSCGAFEAAYFDFLEKITLLKNSGAGIVLLKNSPTLWDMRCAVLAAKTAGVPILVTMEVDEEGKSSSGTDYLAAMITLQALGASGFGICCTDGMETEAELLNAAFPHAEIPLIAVGNISACSAEKLKTLAYSGASVYIDISGELTKEAAEAIFTFGSIFDPGTEKDSYAAAVDCEVFFLPENIELSAPISCSYDMTDDLIDLDDENINSICVYLNSTDDAAVLTENGSMARLPVTVHTNDVTALEAALRYFCGRLIVDTRCDINIEELQQLAEKYGAVLY